MIDARSMWGPGAAPASVYGTAMASQPGRPAVYLHHPSSLEHDTGLHPERAERIPAIEPELERRSWLGMRRVPAPEVEPAALLAVHPDEHVRSIEVLSERGGGAIDPDTVTSRGSYRAALHAAGGAVHMVDLLLGGDGDRPLVGFCGLRPPGHHAEAARAMGFCLFNNVAVAARRARDEHGCHRVMVVDWDVHHGNGTNDIFHSDDEVLFVSIHQWPLYPGTGAAEDAGSGAGLGHTVNLPVPPGSDDDALVSLVAHVAVPLARAYQPQLLLVSAGYDAHRDDPLADCRVTEDGYAAMATALRGVAGELGDVPIGVVLEGGYALGALARSVAATIEALTGVPEPSAVDVEPGPLAVEALARVSRYWPSLSDAPART
jgi:acetoin utilization deacetylase AcuC-like enzyme